MLTFLAAVVPPRVGHAIARLPGIDAAYGLFCPATCCTDRRTL